MKAPTLTKPQRTALETAVAAIVAELKKVEPKARTVAKLESRLDAAQQEHETLSASEDLDDATIPVRLAQAARVIKLLPEKIKEANAEIEPLLTDSHNAANEALRPFDQFVYEPLRQSMIGEIAQSLLPFSRDENSARRLAERSDAVVELQSWRKQLSPGSTFNPTSVASLTRFIKVLTAALAGEELFTFTGAAK